MSQVRDEHVLRLTEALEELPDLYGLLGLFRLPGSRPPDPDRRLGSTSPARPPLDLGVLDLEDARIKPDADFVREDADLDRRVGARRQGVLPTLAAWCRLVDTGLWDAGIAHPELEEPPTVAGSCGFLLAHVGWIGEQSWLSTAADDLHTILIDVRRATGWTPPPALHCSSCRWSVEPQDEGAWYRCTGCSKTWALHNEIRRLMGEQEHLVPLSAAAVQVGRPLSSLKLWVREGLLSEKGQDRRGRLYDLRSVRKIADSKQARVRA